MTVILDVTAIAPSVRHDRIHAALDRLAAGETLELVVDHRPSPLRYKPFEAIMAAAAALDDGQPLVVLAPFEPVPLDGVLGAHGFVHQATELPDGSWRTVFRVNP